MPRISDSVSIETIAKGHWKITQANTVAEVERIADAPHAFLVHLLAKNLTVDLDGSVPVVRDQTGKEYGTSTAIGEFAINAALYASNHP